MHVLWRILIILAVPVILVVLMARVVTLPWFPVWEYSRPGFPPDIYGMASEERLNLARLCIDYLNLPPGMVSLASARFFDGSVAFNERELEHMWDVKLVYDWLTVGALLLFVVAAVAGWLLIRVKSPKAFWNTISDAGLFTWLVLGGVGALMALNWNFFFTAFHGLFFTSGSWLFAYSDTLIRLFPMRFWQDAGMVVVALVAGAAFGLLVLGRVLQYGARDVKRVPLR